VISSPSVADIDHDGRLEIVVGENTGKIYGFEIDGSPVAGFPLTNPTYTVYSSPLLADLDLDGHLELLVGCNDKKVYCWDLGAATYDPELLPWPEFRQDAPNSACVARPAYVTLSTPNATVPLGGKLPAVARSTSIAAKAGAFDLWFRTFDAQGKVAWPTPPGPWPIVLPPGGQVQKEFTLRVEAPLKAGRYWFQAYLGTFGAGSFDTHALALRVVPLGDVNCDDLVNNFDIDPFVLALTDPNEYQKRFPTCNYLTADANLDGVVDNFDIDPFVRLLTP